MSVPATALTAQSWRAHLQLGFESRRGQTVLVQRRHFGPLLVQRPFYPEGEVCHTYLIHPPGGVVGGDELRLDVRLAEGCHALITTPAANKFYRSDGRLARLHQHFQISPNAVLEWLPQEAIFFNAAEARLHTRIDLVGNARFIGWEYSCFGRPASDEVFVSGHIDQGLALYRDGKPVLLDRLRVNGGGDVLQQPWGLRGHLVTANLLMTDADDSALALARDAYTQDSGCELSLSLVDGVLVGRCLGPQAMVVQACLQSIVQTLRPKLLGREFCRPRIWDT